MRVYEQTVSLSNCKPMQGGCDIEITPGCQFTHTSDTALQLVSLSFTVVSVGVHNDGGYHLDVKC